MSQPRVLLANTRPVVLERLRTLLQLDCDVVGAVTDGRALVDAAQRLRPDVVLLESSLPSLNALEAARQVKALVPACKLIFLSFEDDQIRAAEALPEGVSRPLTNESPTELAQLIKETLGGRERETLH